MQTDRDLGVHSEDVLKAFSESLGVFWENRPLVMEIHSVVENILGKTWTIAINLFDLIDYR